MLTIGSKCPDFRDLAGVDGRAWSLADFATHRVLVVLVSCNHCPYVVAYESRIVALHRDYAPRGVGIVAVNANDTSRYPDDNLQAMKARAKERGFQFPYVRDDAQSFVRALGARFTPEAYVFDHERALRYHGRIDDNHRDESRVGSRDLAAALDALLEGKTPPVAETQAFGCSVKWR